VQKHVETLDAIRAKNATAPAKANGSMDVDGHAKARAPHRPPPVSQRRNFQQPSPRASCAELGVVRPAVVGTVHILGGRDHHLAARRLPGPAVRLGALLKPTRCVTVDRSDLRRYLACPWILSISFPLFLLFFHLLSICISTTYIYNKKNRDRPRCGESVQ
jgi:hypothetical protein